MKLSFLRNSRSSVKNPEPRAIAQRLSKLQSPPSNLTRAILAADTQRSTLAYGPEPLTAAVTRFSTWAHASGYTYQDINDYLVYVLRVKYGARPRI